MVRRRPPSVRKVTSQNRLSAEWKDSNISDSGEGQPPQPAVSRRQTRNKMLDDSTDISPSLKA